MSFIRTTAIDKLLKLTKRKRVIQSGTWCGKTYGIIPILINDAIINPNKKITIVAESIPAIKGGALANFKEIMLATNRWNPNNYNGTDRSYTFKNNSQIEFTSFDSIGKAVAAGKRTDLFINEANYHSFEIADALIMRTSGNVWIDYNPTHEFWAHTEILPQPDAELLKLRYTDNEALPQSILNELLNKQEKAKTSEYWKNWCRIYIDGEIGSLEGIIFTNWKSVDNIPAGASYVCSGMDFGYSNDPTTLIDYYKYNNDIYFDEAIYQKGLLNSEIVNLIKSNKTLQRYIYADSAEPKSIQEIRNHGISIIGTNKGKDSINFGISILQEKPFYVTTKSVNMIKELRAYSWDKTKTGETINKPIDAYNHCIDSIRYIAIMKLKKPTSLWL